MNIVGARLKPFGGKTEFLTLKGRVKSLIENNKGDIFDFVIEENGRTSVKEFGPDSINPGLVGKKLPICEIIRRGPRKELVSSPYLVNFNEDGTIHISFDGDELTNESLPREQTVQQWNKLRKMTKGVDIGDRISDMNKQGANIQYIQNPVDTGIESYEDFERHNKKFIPSWNLKHLLSPFGYEKKNKK